MRKMKSDFHRTDSKCKISLKISNCTMLSWFFFLFCFFFPHHKSKILFHKRLHSLFPNNHLVEYATSFRWTIWLSDQSFVDVVYNWILIHQRFPEIWVEAWEVQTSSWKQSRLRIAKYSETTSSSESPRVPQNAAGLYIQKLSAKASSVLTVIPLWPFSVVNFSFH